MTSIYSHVGTGLPHFHVTQWYVKNVQDVLKIDRGVYRIVGDWGIATCTVNRDSGTIWIGNNQKDGVAIRNTSSNIVWSALEDNEDNWMQAVGTIVWDHFRIVPIVSQWPILLSIIESRVESIKQYAHASNRHAGKMDAALERLCVVRDNLEEIYNLLDL